MNQSINKKQLIEIDRSRYEELIACEERIRLLEKAVMKCNLYCDIDLLKRLFIEGGEDESTKPV